MWGVGSSPARCHQQDHGMCEGRWLPIATAPKDGTPILVWRADGVHVARWRVLYGKGFWDQPYLRLRHRKPAPTHWMKLPESPK